jgi:hypothetical protein
LRSIASAKCFLDGAIQMLFSGVCDGIEGTDSLVVWLVWVQCGHEILKLFDTKERHAPGEAEH